MAENKKSFVLYVDLLKSIEHLTNEEKGILFNHLLEYVNDKNPTLDDRLILTAWKPIELQLKRDLIKFEQVKEKRSLAGKASANKREQTPTNPTHVESVEQTPTNPTVNDNDNDNDNVNDNDTVINNRGEEIFSDEQIEYQISKMIVPEILKIWKTKNPKYFSNQEIDNHAALQIAYNIASAKGWKKAEILKEKEKECLNSFGKIADYIMSDDFWNTKTLEMIAKNNNWQKIINGMVERTKQPIASIGQQEPPKKDIEEILKKYDVPKR